MEKRTLLAILLSMAVLFVWTALFPPPKSVKKSQPVENKEIVVDAGVLGEKDAYNTPKTSPPQEAGDEEITTVENDIIVAEFSNIGGTLRKVTLKQYGEALPVSGINRFSDYKHANFKLDYVEDGRIGYSAKDATRKITKTYVLADNDNIIKSTVRITNLTKMSNLISPRLDIFTIDTSALENGNLDRDKSLLEYSIAKEGKIERKGNAYKFSKKESKYTKEGAEWFGFRNRYFVTISKPDFEVVAYETTAKADNKFEITVDAKPMLVQPAESIELKSSILVSPQDRKLLKQYEQGFEKIIIFSSFGLVDGIARIIYSLLAFLHSIVPNWGVCVILISIIIYGATYPLTIRGMASMRKMQLIQPEMAALKEKHKNSPQKLNQEMMEIYKKHKINPFGGCFLLILQMPVFIGLYQVLWRSVFFKGAKFLWIQDLSEPDRLFKLPFELPFLGSDFNLLPILMIGVMFVQQRFSSKNVVISDPAQAAQQKMMTTFLPVFMGFIFYKFASGLCLYFTMFYMLSTFTQYKMSKTVKVA